MVRPRAEDDPLVRGTLRLRQHGVEVELVTAEGVFSAAGVDPGTAFLLRWLPGIEARRVLDVGCGYGPLALWLAAADGARSVVAVDRDAVAVACTAAGAARNGLTDRVRAHGSLGYDDVDPDDRFDLVVSNVPAKVGTAALRHLLVDVWHHLAPGGRVAVVVVQRLVSDVAGVLADAGAVVDEHRTNRGYGAWIYRFDAPPPGASAESGFDRGVYARGGGTFAAGRGVRWTASTSVTLAEFDTLGHGTEAAVELLEARPLRGPEPVAVVGVGQGHLALAVRAIAGAPVAVRLVDRDLLALRTAAANLGGDVDARHVASAEGACVGCSAAVVALPEKEPVGVTAARLAPVAASLGPGRPLVAHGRAADVARVLDLLGRRGGRRTVVERRSVRGGAAASTVAPPS